MIKFLLMVFVLPFLSSCYSFKQAYHFNNLFNSRVKISEVVTGNDYSKGIQKKLRVVQKVIKYAEEEGLNTEGAYEYYIHSSSGSVSFLVQAAEKRKLKFKTWWFPIVGSVPYLGFFERSERDLVYQNLALDYDVAKGNVGAFSSLGWFEDPIYTSMLKRSFTDLAHLFFHELVHRTFWSIGSARFNENLAEFCAEVITSTFLLKQGRGVEIDTYFAQRRDKKKYKSWLKNLRIDLKDLYAQKALSASEIIKKKKSTINQYKANIPRFETGRYLYIKDKDWNNASILGASLYAPDTERFYRAYDCIGRPKISQFLEKLKKVEDIYEDNFIALDSLCKNAGKGSQP